MNENLTFNHDERAVTVALTRAEKRNALDLATSRALDAALDAAAEIPLPLVLRSATPGMFIAGTDVAALRRRTVEDSLGRVNARLFQHVEDHPWPTIAVVDGWALGGGCELALSCDLRITTEDALWGLPEVRLGIIPSGGGLTRLAGLVGRSVASDLVLTGRRLDGVEAHRLGLAQRLTTREGLDDALSALLDELGETSTQAVRLAKEAMRVDGDRHRLVDAAAQALCIGSEEAQRRIAKLLERRSG